LEDIEFVSVFKKVETSALEQVKCYWTLLALQD
jgi:hypothetical protein